MRFGLLGPLLVEGAAGTVVPLTSRKGRLLLGALLLRANETAPTHGLLDALWGDAVPPTARASLQNHVARLRGLFGPAEQDRIRTTASGYLIRVEPGELDTEEFRRLAEDARSARLARDWESVSRAAAAALRLWRGRLLEDLPTLAETEPADPFQHALETSRLQLRSWRAAAELRLGRHHDLIPELASWAAEHPLAEELQRDLMTALLRDGRRADALEVFTRLRLRLSEELGVDPGAAVQKVYLQALTEEPPAAITDSPGIPAAAVSAPPRTSHNPALTPDPARAPTTAASGATGAVPPARCQLPSEARAFTGREAEVERLLACARHAADGEETGWAVVAAVDGMAGVGKSALAVHVAQRVRGDFPDGQLFLDLRGWTPNATPMTTAEALDALLRSLDVPPQTIPKDPAERARRLRDRLAGTRTLIVLDNAVGSAQIRPLLPATSRCLVLVTSRKRLTGLDDSLAVPLRVLSEDESLTLLRRVAGPDRVPEDQPEARELAALCGFVPLALRIAAAQLRRRRSLRLTDLVDRLRDEHHRLPRFDQLDGTDREAEPGTQRRTQREAEREDRGLSAVFATSFTALPATEQRLLTLLAGIPGADVDVAAAAALLGADTVLTEQLLDSLLDQNLLTQHVPGRYGFHDLIRLYCRAPGHWDADEYRTALDRLLAHYERDAEQAAARLRRSPRAATATAGKPDERGEEAALAWMRTERENLLAFARFALAGGRLPRRRASGIALALALAPLLHQEGPLPDAVALLRQAAEAARAGGDRLGRAECLTELGRIHMQRGEFTEAQRAHTDALELYRAQGERLGEAGAIYESGTVHLFTGHYATALPLLERSLELFGEMGSELGQANALFQLGRAYRLTGDLAKGGASGARALRLYVAMGKRWGEGHVLCDLARVHQLGGDLRAAVELGERGLAAFQAIDNQLGAATACQALGRIHHDLGELDAAAELFGRALRLFRATAAEQAIARSLWDLGRVSLSAGAPERAADLNEQALRIFQASGSRNGEANVRHDLGRALHALGRTSEAAELLAQARELFRDLGDPHGEAEVLNSTGALRLATEGAEASLACHKEALVLARRVRSPLEEARALEGLGRAHAALGETARSRTELREALVLYRRIGAALAAEKLLQHL
ncbi:AfsR/SARP family transcriptional regulator [Streptacidiphilus jiangxiensis]|uniref:DNA-binding transcriptional activator of the SARP family n=1 Tax=Streptacidiphilus jiangxiensis TaxID=235985 RepID=A0A1H7L4A6_STRJI|nr:tetratricopeptide repeat protein [Streptacidiphilus jiangxiensis]SEK93526.1 DNA-binding transcriptional activator of the SARP family [Streptacidiphilus jiangxiensis]